MSVRQSVRQAGVGERQTVRQIGFSKMSGSASYRQEVRESLIQIRHD